LFSKVEQNNAFVQVNCIRNESQKLNINKINTKIIMFKMPVIQL